MLLFSDLNGYKTKFNLFQNSRRFRITLKIYHNKLNIAKKMCEILKKHNLRLRPFHNTEFNFKKSIL